MSRWFYRYLSLTVGAISLGEIVYIFLVEWPSWPICVSISAMQLAWVFYDVRVRARRRWEQQWVHDRPQLHCECRNCRVPDSYQS